MTPSNPAKPRSRWSLLVLLSSMLAVASGCSASASPLGAAHQPSAPPPPMAQQGYGDPSGYGQQAPAPAAPGATMQPPDAYRAENSRPGLATHWGETRSSHIRTTSFTRASGSQPSALATLWYNDSQGARAQAQSEGYRALDRGEAPMAQSGIVVSLRDESGRTLSGYNAGGKTFAVGEAGQRYVIVLQNRTPARFEVVASVDGLDVINGKAGTFDNRGYILNPHSTLEIDGFRQSESTVAAFRFGSVRGSYADRKGDDRNVGVIGVAIFHEQGFPMWPWDPNEIERRRNANPFPGQFAAPPP